MTEIIPTISQKCLLSESELKFLEQGPTSSDLQVIIDLLAEGGLKYMDIKSWGRFLKTCKTAFIILSKKPFWLASIGYSLPVCPKNFSPLRLFVLLSKKDNAEWKRNLLTDAVNEERKSKGLTSLYISITEQDSADFWKKQLVHVLSLSNYPTLPEVDELKQVVKLLKEKKQSSKDLVLASSKAKDNRPNKVMFVVFAHTLLTEYKKELTKDDLADLLVDVNSILQLIGLMHGITVDKLKDAKWTLNKCSIPSVLRRAIVISLSRLTWLSLCDCFKKPGLCKVLFKSIHISSILKKEQSHTKGDEAEGLRRVYLLQAVLRKAKYPKTKEEFEKFLKDIIEPLKNICDTNPLFDMKNKSLLSDSFVTAFAGKPINRPVKKTVEATLALNGNTKSTWENIFKNGVITVPQILQSMNSLIMLDYPGSDIEKILSNPKNFESVDIIKIIKLRQLIKATYTNEYVEELIQARELAVKEDKSNDKHDSEIKIKMKAKTFKDKKGNTVSREQKRNLALSFSKNTVEGYLSMIDRLFESKFKILTQKESKLKPKHSIILLTSEMLNPVRTGMPPSIPAYTRSSLWRNEGICLQELSLPGENLDTILLGLSWCQPHGSDNSVDLDLSVMLYNEKFEFLDQVSFTKLEIPGIKHSGDVRAAPFPEGGRETVEINLPKLKSEMSKCKYIAMNVYSYTKQRFDSLDDASVFVANPFKTGQGPGGTDVISAARLSGNGCTNISGFLDIEDVTQSFYCIDQTLNTEVNTTESSQDEIRSNIMRIVESVKTNNGADLKLSILASIYASILSEEVHIVHKDGETVVKLEENSPEGRIKLLHKLEQTLTTLKPAVKPPKANIEWKEGEKVIVFGGDNPGLFNVADVYNTFVEHESFTYANLRAEAAKDEIKQVRKADVRVLSGSNLFDLL